MKTIKITALLAMSLTLWSQISLAQTSLNFNGTSAYVDMGAATSTLGATNFTVECWFKRTGVGITANTGGGGVTGVPIVTKGKGESENPGLNCNYYLAITTTNTLTADFEEVSGPNHPLAGTLTVTSNVWHHAALTYDGTNLVLYLDGVLDNSIAASGVPDYTSKQHAGIGTSMTSTGAAGGFFAGDIDEVRIWNYARSQADIQAAMNTEIASAPGLLGRWGLNDGSGAVATNSVTGSPDGTIHNATWTIDVPFGGVPQSVSLTAPTNNSIIYVGSNVTLTATATSTGTVSQVEFFANGSSLGVDTSSPYTLDWTPVASGAVALTAVVSDNSSLVTTSAVVNVTVVGAPIVQEQSPTDVQVFAGATPTLQVTAIGSGSLAYQWSLNSSPIPGATSSSYVVTNTSSVGANTYSCTITNSYGPTTATPITVTVLNDPTAPYSLAVLADSPVAFFRLSELSGTTAYDYVGGNNATYTNVTLGYSGYPEDAAAEFGDYPSGTPNNDFAGNVPSYLNFGTNTGNGEFSVEAWVFQYFGGLSNAIVTLGYGGGGNQFDLDAGATGGKLRFTVTDAAGSAHTASSSQALNDGHWHHVVGVCDQANGHTYLYLDGALVASTTIPVNGGILASTMPLSIGAREGANYNPRNYDYQFDGQIDDVAIYNQALSSAQVQAHYFASGVAPQITQVQPASLTTNQSANVSFTVTASGTEPLSYQWYDNNNNPIAWGTNATLNLTNVQSSQQGSYRVDVSNTYGGPVSTNVNLTVTQVSQIVTDITPSNLVVYATTPTTLSVTASGSPPLSYQWYQDGAMISNATNATYSFAALLGTNTYYLSVTNVYSDGSPTLSSTATVVGLPIITLTPTNYTDSIKITFAGYNRSETLSDFPVLVRLSTNLSGFNYSHFADPMGGDLRFTDSGGTRVIPFEIDQWNTNGESTVWVQVPELSDTNTFIWAYWGNPADATLPDYATNGAVWLSQSLQSLPPYEVVYHLEQDGFPYLDSTLQYTATNGTAPLSTNGLIAQGLSFNKAPYLDAGLVNLGNAFTLSAWVNVPASDYSIQAVWDNGNGVAYSPECQFYVNNYNTSDGTLTLTTGDGVNQIKLQSAAGAVSFDQWHLITAVADRTDGTGQLYVDGNQVASGGVLTGFPTNTDMNLGRANNNSYQYTGLIDEARIRSGLESSNWVWASYMTVAQNASLQSYSAVVSMVVAPPSPVTINVQFSGGNLVLSGSGGSAGATYYVIGSTNVALPLASWPILSTNTFDGSGNFNVSMPVDATKPAQFLSIKQ